MKEELNQENKEQNNQIDDNLQIKSRKEDIAIQVQRKVSHFFHFFRDKGGLFSCLLTAFYIYTLFTAKEEGPEDIAYGMTVFFCVGICILSFSIAFLSLKIRKNNIYNIILSILSLAINGIPIGLMLVTMLVVFFHSIIFFFESVLESLV